ncbi:MAG: mechanosensitive ion channel [Agriterribacter sp.]
MKSLAQILATCITLFFFNVATAQDSTNFRRDSTRWRNDTTRHWGNDTARFRRGGMMSIFSDSNKLTTSDYQLQIEKTFVLLEKIDNNSDLGPAVKSIRVKLRDSDSALSVLKDNVLNNSQALSVRNLEVYKTLLQSIEEDLEDHREQLDSADARLSLLKKDMRTLIGDTIMKQMMQDSALRQQFSTQMKDMRTSWRGSTKHLRESQAMVDQLQTQTSANTIITIQLLEKVDNLLANSTARLFGKEYNYLWEKTSDSASRKMQYAFKKAYSGERKALRYYFKDSGPRRLFLLLIGLVFFIWIYRNIYIIKKRNAFPALKDMDFSFILSGYIVSSLVVLFTIAPLFDLHAPSVYVESMQFLLVIVLTIICWKKWPRRLFLYWIGIVLLFICFSFMHHVIAPGLLQRGWLIVLNVLSIIIGYLFLTRMQQHLYLKGFIRFVIILHNVMNALSIVCNIFGRFSLAQILGNTAIFSFTHVIGLAVFSKIIIEAILLQIATSRIVRGRNIRFDFEHVLNGFRRPVLFLIVILWMIVFTTNLNVYSSLLDVVITFLNQQRNIGSATFSFGSILLFFFIIWMAHLLQKYIGYFFGETGEDNDIVNKGKRSRLLITKLLLLCAGYFLAIAASGLPVDKITIVLGALGVGIGLGLQSIVNNFVSGIVLIFDRPIQIGDAVEIGNKAGRVKEINLRSSTLLTDDGAEVIIPNGDMLTQHIVNWTLSNNQQRLEMDLTISGSKDMEKVASAIKKTILTSKHIYENREPQVLFTAVHEDGFSVKVFFWSADVYISEEARSEILLLLHEKLPIEALQIK